jgi:orotidine-5'-phosphate decarboxylase
MQSQDRLVVAVDLSSRQAILSLIDELQGAVGIFKIGPQAFIANGPSIVREIVDRGAKVFLDLKIHDIPNTAEHAVAEAAALGASILTVHAAGGFAMLKACSRTASLVLGVTILTSLNEEELRQIGFHATVLDSAVRLALLSKHAGLRGVVASPQEIEAIRKACGDGFVILAPGIRPLGADVGDQRRTMTPSEAIARGADYIVVGRPITGAANRRDAALQIVEEMDARLVS